MDEVAVDIKEDGAVELLIDDMGLKDLVVEGLGCPLGGRHFGLLCDGRRPSRMASIVCLMLNSQPSR